MPPDPSEQAAVVVAFLHRAERDRATTGLRPLAAYRAAYPGFEDLIDREYAALVDPAGRSPSIAETLNPADEPVAVDLDDAAPPTTTAEERTIGRYDDIGEIARGGMGTVHVVWDRDLRRRLAMKLLLQGAPDEQTPPPSTAQIARFLEEAQITSQLEHPGIVPVHELGLDANGRVFFTMALVDGRTFADVITATRRDDDEEWTRTRALGVLLRACEAVGFAHSKRVIHRDLKPANIMVGQFGEVYVMDWGLCRVLDEPQSPGPIAAAPPPAADPDGHALRTHDGDVLGTPAYMPPEQARGEVEQLGYGADVYALGAVLYHLLTGVMPYADSDTSPTGPELVDAVIAGPPPPLDRVAPSTPAELIAICERAMARSPDERYASVQELAGDLRAFLEVRVVGAYETGAVAEFRKWVRRNRATATVGAAAILALTGALVFALLERHRADAAASRAATNFTLAEDAVEELVRIGGAELANVPQVDGVRREMLEVALAFHLRFAEADGTSFDVRDRAATAWASAAEVYRQLGRMDDAFAAYEQSTAALSALADERPDDPSLRDRLAWEHVGIGSLHIVRGEYGAAIERYRTAQAIYARLIERVPDNVQFVTRSGHVRHNLAAALNWQRKYEEAFEVIRAVVAERERLCGELPNDAERRFNLATSRAIAAFSLQRLTRVEEAKSQLVESTTALDEVLAAEPGSRLRRLHAGTAWNSRGEAHRRLEEYDDALAAYRRAAAIQRTLVADYPGVPQFHSDLGSSMSNVARVHLTRREPESARDAAAAALTAQRIAVEQNPDYTLAVRRLGRHYSHHFRALSWLRDHRGLARSVDEFVASGHFPAKDALYTAGQQFARCATYAAGDDASPDDERRTLADGYARRAIEALRGALDAGRPRARWSLDSTTFVDVRKRPEFAALQAAVDALPQPDEDPTGR